MHLLFSDSSVVASRQASEIRLEKSVSEWEDAIFCRASLQVVQDNRTGVRYGVRTILINGTTAKTDTKKERRKIRSIIIHHHAIIDVNFYIRSTVILILWVKYSTNSSLR